MSSCFDVLLRRGRELCLSAQFVCWLRCQGVRSVLPVLGGNWLHCRGREGRLTRASPGGLERSTSRVQYS
eukprot:scaffold12365_cov19-Tisochrysis_lutea.AAC.3